MSGEILMEFKTPIIFIPQHFNVSIHEFQCETFLMNYALGDSFGALIFS